MPSPTHAGSVAVIGCGHWGQNLVRNFAALGALTLVCDAAPAGRARARELARDVQIARTLEAVWASSVAGVVVATPAETHHTIARLALEAGKDVLVEKPLALNVDQGRELVDLADRRGRVLMVGHVLEYHPGVRRLVELVASGDLGKVRFIYSNRLSLGKIRREENILWSFAPHDLAVTLRLMASPPLEVVAVGGSYIQRNVPDVTVTHLLFDDGVRAHIFVSWLHPFKEQRLVVVGSSKMASFDDVSKQLVVYDQYVTVEAGGAVPVRGTGTEVAYAATEPLRLECEAFLSAMTTREPPLTDGRSGLGVLEVLQAAQQSVMANGQPVKMPVHRPSQGPPVSRPSAAPAR